MLKGIVITIALACATFASPARAAENQPTDTIVALDFSLQPGTDNQSTESTQLPVEHALLAESVASPKAKRQPSWKEIKRLEIVYQVLNAIDAAETIHCLSMTNCHEANPLLGKHPSTIKLVAIKAGGGILHYVLMKRTFARNPRAARIAEIVSIGFQGAVVGANIRIFF